MSKYIDADKLIAEIERRKNQTERRLDNIVPIRRKDAMDEEQLAKIELRDKVDKAYLNGVLITLSDILSFITSLQQEQNIKEQEREKRYQDARMEYWSCVLKTIDSKRILPTFKGQLLHDFKNELHTMKQVVGLINHPEIPEGLFNKLALVFATWGGYHFHPEETEIEDSLQHEQPEMNLDKEIKDTCREYRINDYHEQELGKHDIENIARHFYELGLNARKEE